MSIIGVIIASAVFLISIWALDRSLALLFKTPRANKKLSWDQLDRLALHALAEIDAIGKDEKTAEQIQEEIHIRYRIKNPGRTEECPCRACEPIYKEYKRKQALYRAWEQQKAAKEAQFKQEQAREQANNQLISLVSGTGGGAVRKK